MPGKTSTYRVPRTVPKLEAELIADEYATFVGDDRTTGSDADVRIASLSTDERRELRRRLLALGVSEDTVSQVGFDDLDRDP